MTDELLSISPAKRGRIVNVLSACDRTRQTDELMFHQLARRGRITDVLARARGATPVCSRSSGICYHLRSSVLKTIFLTPHLKGGNVPGTFPTRREHSEYKSPLGWGGFFNVPRLLILGGVSKPFFREHKGSKPVIARD